MRLFNWNSRLAVLLLGLCASAAASAELIVTPETLPETENAVYTADGRYFVAGVSGIHEVLPARADGLVPPGCQVDAAKGHAVCLIVPPALDGQPCFFTGMTTDGQYLYAACTAGANVVEPVAAALYRVLPAVDGAEVKIGRFATPVWYNGMAMAPDGGIFMSSSASGSFHGGGDGVAVVKATVTGTAGDELLLSLADWLPTSLAYLMPNGIAVQGSTMYFVGGQNLFRIPIKADGKAGLPVQLFQTGIGRVLDDLTVAGDRVVVTDVPLLPGVGFNWLVSVAKSGWGLPRWLNTGGAGLSSVTVSPGGLVPAGQLIATSYFDGGIHGFPLP